MIDMLQKSTTLKTLNISINALTMKEIGQLLVPNHPAFPTVLDFKRRNLKGEDLDQFVNGLKKNTHVERIEFNLKQLN